MIDTSKDNILQVSHVRGDKEFREFKEFKTYVCQHRILKNPEEARMAGNVLNFLNSLNSLSTKSKRACES